MLTSSLEKIVRHSKDIILSNNMSFHKNADSTLAYKMYVAKSKSNSKALYLVHKNLHFNAGTIDNTSYEIYKFDDKGKYIGKVNDRNVTATFLRDLETLYNL